MARLEGWVGGVVLFHSSPARCVCEGGGRGWVAAAFLSLWFVVLLLSCWKKRSLVPTPTTAHRPSQQNNMHAPPYYLSIYLTLPYLPFRVFALSLFLSMKQRKNLLLWSEYQWSMGCWRF